MDKEIKNYNEKQNGFYNELVSVGKAMFDLYSCRPLSAEQIEILATASDEDKVLGMNLVVGNRLTISPKYNTYSRNVDAIKAGRLLKKSK